MPPEQRPGRPRELHPDLPPEERRRLLLLGIDLFNRGEFYEAHEAWEDVWRSTTPEPKDLLQGLIQVAAAMHQFRDLGRLEAPRRTLAKARRRLEGYGPVVCGMDVAGVLEGVGAWEAWLVERRGAAPSVPRVGVVDDEAVR